MTSSSASSGRPAPNVLWVADITYLRTWEGWLYLAAVQDAYSRRIVGWSMADHMRAELVVDALQMALARRRPEPGLIHHSDQGSQFVSLAFGQAARDAGIALSMGSKGDCFDNAVAESFFATLKKELVHRRSWPTRRELHQRGLRIHRGLLQPRPPTLDARHALARWSSRTALSATDRPSFAASRLRSSQPSDHQQLAPESPTLSGEPGELHFVAIALSFGPPGQPPGQPTRTSKQRPSWLRWYVHESEATRTRRDGDEGAKAEARDRRSDRFRGPRTGSHPYQTLLEGPLEGDLYTYATECDEPRG